MRLAERSSTLAVIRLLKLKFGGERVPRQGTGSVWSVHRPVGAIEMRDGDGRFGGKGVRSVIQNINTEIAAALSGMDALDQRVADAK